MTHSRPPAGPAPDLNRSAVARYLQLATLFRHRVESGVWPPGTRIPTVDELAAECGVARATIRQALDELAADGLIERFRARGTFVSTTPPPRLWCDVETDWNGLLRSREGARIEILSDTPDQDGAAIPAAPGPRAPLYRHLRRRHWREQKPFLLADVWLDQRLSPLVTPDDLLTKTALRLVAGLPGIRIAAAHQTLTIGSADVETAAALHLPLNAPVAHVHRTAMDPAGTLLLVARGIYRGDTVRIDVKLR
jgi:GntR family transcriptional regulator